MLDFSIIKLQKCKKSFIKIFIIIYSKKSSLSNLKLINVFLKYYNEIIDVMCDCSNFTIITYYHFLFL